MRSGVADPAAQAIGKLAFAHVFQVQVVHHQRLDRRLAVVQRELHLLRAKLRRARHRHLLRRDDGDQRHRIGRRRGCELVFQVSHAFRLEVDELPVFTTQVEAVYGATFLLLHPEHPAYGILNACRIAYSLVHHEVVVSKYAASQWARDALPATLRPAAG